MKKVLIFTLIIAFFIVGTVSAQTAPILTAKGVAVYGWKDGVATPLYVQKEHYLFPIASLTKLITAKAVEELYGADSTFTISDTASKALGDTTGIVPGAVFSRDDLLTALLVRSSNDAGLAFMEPVGKKTFLATMNSIIKKYGYTKTSFINNTGLDPKKKTGVAPNRMTPYHLSRLVNDIYNNDPLLVSLMSKPSAEIVDHGTGATIEMKNTNLLFQNPEYRDSIIMSKTGLTNMAGQNLVFVTKADDTFDYETVVLLGSKHRTLDGAAVIDWLTSRNKVATTTRLDPTSKN